MPDIELQGISKRYGSTQVLDHLSLTIHHGEFLTLLGPSGCGKSTLLKLLAGLELPDSGSIRLQDTDLLSKSPSERDCAMVFQSYALYPHMTVCDNICTPLYMRSLSGFQRLPGVRWISPRTRHQIKTAQAQGLQVAKTLGIDHLWLRKPAQLSGGQRQRVALARALVRRPSLFMFDEPLSNLDANLRQSLRSEIRQLHAELGITFLYVTHDQHEAMSMSDRVAVMKNGQILQLGTPTEIYDDPKHKDVALAVGSPRINILDILEKTSRDPLGLGLYAEAASLAFRPHAARLIASPDALSISGQVTQIEFTGSERMVSMQTPHGDPVMIVLDRQTHPHLQTGTCLTVHVPLGALHVFDANGVRIPVALANGRPMD